MNFRGYVISTGKEQSWLAIAKCAGNRNDSRFPVVYFPKASETCYRPANSSTNSLTTWMESNKHLSITTRSNHWTISVHILIINFPNINFNSFIYVSNFEEACFHYVCQWKLCTHFLFPPRVLQISPSDCHKNILSGSPCSVIPPHPILWHPMIHFKSIYASVCQM